MAKYLSFDVGSKTIGIAKSDGFLATPLATVRFQELDFVEAINKLETIILQEKPIEIAIGLPRNMDGTLGHRVQMVREFTSEFTSHFKDIKITEIDERLTTKIAKSIMVEANLSRKKQKNNKDTLAAMLIMETFLATKK